VRCYEHPVLLTGDCAFAELVDTAGALLESVEGVNRCIWNAAPEPPREVRLRAAATTRERLDLLREVDAVVMSGLRRHGLYGQIWQCPTVLVPLVLDGKGSELVIVRPIKSERAMTATAAELPGQLLDEIRETVLAWPEVSGLAVDLTSKPPGTIEWE
jgi:GMP synthase (glutamine-hydrolysing)